MRLQLKNNTGILVITALLLTAVVYWPGLSGSFLFDDYPNIVDNDGVQPKTASLSTLVAAALSSPSSDFSRPIASLSFAINYLISGLDPYGMKLTNLVIHLLNGILFFLLSRTLLCITESKERNGPNAAASACMRTNVVAALITASWLILPINLTAVLYIVQRMESLANLFVLLGLIGYATGRRRMFLDALKSGLKPRQIVIGNASLGGNFALCATSIVAPTAMGILAKETAVMLPLYAFMIEWTLFEFRVADSQGIPNKEQLETLATNTSTWASNKKETTDRRVLALFIVTLVLPLLAGLFWLLPKVLSPQGWLTRDFTLPTRLLSEPRIVVDYIYWTLLPTPQALSFYHDDFIISSGFLEPWTTLTSMLVLVGLVALALWIRSRRPLVSLGVFLFLGCHLLTGTFLPLELIYEHRNYFASFGLLLAAIPLLAAPASYGATTGSLKGHNLTQARTTGGATSFAKSRYLLLAGLFLGWTGLTAFTAYAWGNPLRLAIDLASRAPESPRAQYELGRTYIILSHYDPRSPFTHLAYAPLERAAALPKSSILPEQALIFMNARMHLPLKEAWWNSLIAKLKARPPTIQDESSLASLTQCARENSCDFPTFRMEEAFKAALSHPNPTARLLANYGDYAWNVLDDKQLGLAILRKAVQTSPNEPAYHITMVRMLVVLGKFDEAKKQLSELSRLNYGGRLNSSLAELRALPGMEENARNQPNNI